MCTSNASNAPTNLPPKMLANWLVTSNHTKSKFNKVNMQLCLLRWSKIGRASCREGGLVTRVKRAEDGIRDGHVTGVQTCALPICLPAEVQARSRHASTRQPCVPRMHQMRPQIYLRKC